MAATSNRVSMVPHAGAAKVAWEGASGARHGKCFMLLS